MSDEARIEEWPLIAFTLGVQFACGMLLAAVSVDTLGSWADVAPARPLGLVVFPSIAVATLCSLFHLGRPLDAWKSILNLAGSRLSQEVVLTGLFAAAALPYSAMWYGGIVGVRPQWGIATAVLGIAAVACGASIYVVPGRPAWNSWWVPMSFVGAVLLLAGSASAVLVNAAGAQDLVQVLLAATVAGSLLQIVSALWMLSTASTVVRRQSVTTGGQDVRVLRRSSQRWSFALHLLLAGMLPACLAAWLWIAGPAGAQPVNGAVLSLVVLAPLAGTVLGRRLMFTLGASASRF